jgi:hypothetical protein
MPEEYFLTLVGPRVAPANRPGASGLPLEDGHTLPFVVDRGWVGPAGTYIEQWSIRDGDKILYRHPAKYIEVRGFQSVRRFSDTVRAPLRLEPGIYDITFVVEDYRMGSFAVEAGPLSEHAEHVEHAEAPPAAEPAAAPPAAAPVPKPAAAPAPAPKPAAAAVAAPATPAAAYTGEDPAAVRKRVYEEELAKGSDPRVAEARSKSAEIKAKKAMAAAATQAAPAAPAPEPAKEEPTPAPARPAASPPEGGRPAQPAAVGLRPGEPVAPEAAPSALAAAAPAVPAPSGEDPAAARKRVYEEELAKGSDPRVAEARAKSAEVRAKRAASAPAPPAAPSAPRAAATPAGAPPPAPPAPPAASGPLLPDAPPDGGGMNAADAASVRTMIFQQEVDQGTAPLVAEALAKAAEIRVQRGVWWRPDW